jgi:hypothetical protein
MRRRVAAWFLIIHAFAHSFAGTSSWYIGRRWAASFFAIAIVAYFAAGLGLLRVPALRRWWKAALVLATVASMHLLVWYRPPWAIPGMFLDVALFVAILGAWQARLDADIAVVDAVGAGALRHPRWVATGWTLGAVAMAYAAMVLVMRPVALEWGTTAEERSAALAGDEVHPMDATYTIDHGITIRAPASAVWPWLVQLGQNRGGFYSYDWLERAFGDDVRNADRIHPEWQHRQIGDTVFATPPDYLGGRVGALGWRVDALEPERVLGLENWGTFVLRPVDASTTRLIVRTRGAPRPGAASFLTAPITVFVFEPAHFIMERAMLRGIRDRAEGTRS